MNGFESHVKDNKECQIGVIKKTKWMNLIYAQRQRDIFVNIQKTQK